jgi:hypothetical protein
LAATEDLAVAVAVTAIGLASAVSVVVVAVPTVDTVVAFGPGAAAA